MIKYLGSKRTLLAQVLAAVGAVEGARSVADLFSGTSRVGHALKAAGYRVLANDHLAYAHALARCYVEADLEDVGRDAERLIAELNRLPGRPGYVTETFCERARYFQPANGARIDAVRDAIAAKGLPPDLEAVLLVSLMEAADRVDSTTGVQMAYLKQWAPRASRPLELRMPRVLPRAAAGKGRAFRMEAAEAAARLEADVAYLDPPYNQHSYLGNYHVWETLVTWDAPQVYGRACKRVDCRERRSPFNSRRRCRDALADVVAAVRAPVLVVSFSDEGFLARAELEALLATRGTVFVRATDYKRYVGAQIGIHDPRGRKVGRVGRLRNTEYLFVAGATRRALAGLPGWTRAGTPDAPPPRSSTSHEA
ncbi:MAG: DNA adenine methylase [Myxococcota bacterium]|nr:DNA adenine methylase [Myxococcota bacterium]